MKARTILVLMLVALFGCFSIFAQAQQEKVATGPVEIEMWYGATATEAGPLPDDWAGYAVLLNDHGIKLTASSLPSSESDQDTKIQAAAAADVLPDFFMCSREVFMRLANNGMVADVTDYYAKMPERSKVMFDDAAKAFTTIDGRSYGFATPSTWPKNEGLLIRKDWLDKLGLSVPKTTEEFLDVMRAFTYKDPDGNGINDTWGFGAFIETGSHEAYPGRRLEPLMGAFGVEGTWDISKANFGLSIHDPNFYKFMEFMKVIIEEGLIDPNWLSYKKDDFRAAWKQGKFGIFREQNAAYAAENNYKPFDANFPNGSFEIIEGPIGPDGYQSIGPYTPGLRIWCISQKAFEQGKADKIVEMFEWASYGEGYMLCGFGVEGVNYTIGEDGLPHSTQDDLGYEKPIGTTYIQLRNMAFNFNNESERLSRYPVYTTATSKKQMSAAWAMEEMQDKKWTIATGSNSLAMPSTDLKTFYEQGLAQFFANPSTITKANWDKFIQQFDKLGGLEWEKAGYEDAVKNNYLI